MVLLIALIKKKKRKKEKKRKKKGECVGGNVLIFKTFFLFLKGKSKWEIKIINFFSNYK
jgi:hypothetical protein